MRQIILIAASVTLGLATSPLYAGAGSQGRKADCLFEVHDKRLIDGPCRFFVEHGMAGSFMIRNRSGAFAHVLVTGMGADEATGWMRWNGGRAQHSIPGTLFRNGACWQNHVARVCAWKPGEPRYYAAHP
jgi:hypothetical protein